MRRTYGAEGGRSCGTKVERSGIEGDSGVGAAREGRDAATAPQGKPSTVSPEALRYCVCTQSVQLVFWRSGCCSGCSRPEWW